MNQYQIKTLTELYNSCPDKTTFNWLDGLSYSQSFLICVCAGPWRFERRQKVQGAALEWLGSNDLKFVNKSPRNNAIFPLDWQQKFVLNMLMSLRNISSMEHFCKLLCDRTLCTADYARQELYKACGVNNKGAKVLSLFCRDALKIDAFPIDRHVRRILKENNLPIKENEMIDLCRVAKLDPRIVATSLIKTANIENPQWNNFASQLRSE